LERSPNQSAYLVAFLLRVRDAGKRGDNATAFTLAHLTEQAKAQAAAIAERKGADLPRRPDVEPLDRWLSALRLLAFLPEEETHTPGTVLTQI
jgi:hypothetical protein